MLCQITCVVVGTEMSQRKYQLMPGLRHECFHEKAPKDKESIDIVVNYLNAEYEAAQSIGGVVVNVE